VPDVQRFGHPVEPRLLRERQVAQVRRIAAERPAEREPVLDLVELVEDDASVGF